VDGFVPDRGVLPKVFPRGSIEDDDFADWVSSELESEKSEK
jgi:hypothetical protein